MRRKRRSPNRTSTSCASPTSARAARTTRPPTAGRKQSHRRHRLPRNGDLDGPQHDRVHAHGRRRRAMDWPGPVHRGKAHLRELGRRHVLPQRHPGDSRRRRGRREYHVQDPLQRRRRDDWRPAFRRTAHAGDDCPASRRGRRQAHHRRQRRAGQISGQLLLRRHPHPSSRRIGRDSARDARHPRLHGAAVRPDLRRGKAAEEEARQIPRSREARRHQRTGLRRLRRLRRAVELRVDRARRDRVRPQADDRPVVVQQGFLLRQGFLPVVRHCRRRPIAQADEGGGGRFFRTCRHRRCRRRPNRTACW